MCDHFEECRRRFDKIDKTLEDLNTRLFKGNGKEAWDVRLVKVEAKAESTEQEVDGIAGTFKKGIWSLWAAIVTFVGKIIYDGFTG